MVDAGYQTDLTEEEIETKLLFERHNVTASRDEGKTDANGN